MTDDAKRDCEHRDFSATVGVGRLTGKDGERVVGYCAEISIKCSECGLPFVFAGLPVGSLPRGAATNVEATELRAAIAPQGSTPTMADECQQIGFLIRGGVPS